MRLFSTYGLFLLLGITSWIGVVLLRFTESVLIIEFTGYERSAVYAAFIVFNTLFVQTALRKVEKWEVIDLLWKLFVVGSIGLGVVGLGQLAHYLLREDKLAELILPIVEALKLYGFVIFCLTAVYTYRKLIFFQKTRVTVIFWRIMEVMLLISLIFLFDFSGPGANSPDGLVDTTAEYIELARNILIPAFLILAVVLSIYQLNWSGYLNFRQKLKAILLMFMIMLLFLGYYFYTFPHAIFNTYSGGLLLDLTFSRFSVIGLLFYFPVVYTALSGTVLIFNLPTSSIFDQRSSEIASFQQITKSIQANLNSDEIINTLADAAVFTSNADVGWMETAVLNDQGEIRNFEIGPVKNISRDEIQKLKHGEELEKEVVGLHKYLYIRNIRKYRSLKRAKTRYRSLIIIPVMTRNKPVGVLYLAHALTNAFEEETIQSVVSLSDQAAIALENAELVQRTIAYETFQTQVQIAKEVQKEILPGSLPSHPRVEFFVRSQDVAEIGGDYYDVEKLNDDRGFRITLGDVSGKGTRAAFYMAETKGVFQALNFQMLDAKEYVVQANNAIKRCFQQDHFMTLVLLEIDFPNNQVSIMDAGHTPVLVYSNSEKRLLRYKPKKTLALGVVKENMYRKSAASPEYYSFEENDLMVLYTDGIIEAKNNEGELFGEERLQDMIVKYRDLSGEELTDKLISKVKEFAGEVIDDDYTILVIRFL